MGTRSMESREEQNKSLLSNEKKGLAEHYLSETTLPTIDVAYLLGYTESSSFARVFKNWTGKTISDVRKA